MLSLFIFFVIIILKSSEATNSGTDSPIIKFDIQLKESHDPPFLKCDHGREEAVQNINKYTVHEGETFKIDTKYYKVISHIICYANNDETNNLVIDYEQKNVKNRTTFTAYKRRGGLWKCTVLVHRDSALIEPVVQYDNHAYSAADCYMKIHVRQKMAPQTILVNNTVVPAVRTNLSQKDVDFIAEYRYEDGDVLNVICICDNFLNEAPLTMEYKMAGTMSDKSTMDDLSSSKMIGFVTRLHSGHNNSYMTCTHTEPSDYTKVLVKFVMETTRNSNNIVLLKNNGILVRPYLDSAKNNHYRIEYKMYYNAMIDLSCEPNRTDVKMSVRDVFWSSSNGSSSSYNKSDLILNKERVCRTTYLNGTMAEAVSINFTGGEFPIEEYPLHMELPTNGRVMELHNDFRLNVIFYEFKDGETLQLTCGQLRLPPTPGAVLYLQIDSEKCEKNGCAVSKTLNITREHENIKIVCYLKEKSASTHDIVRREIRVILRERVQTATTYTSTTNFGVQSISEITPSSNNDTLAYCLAVGVVMTAIISVVVYLSMKKRCWVRPSAPIPTPKPDPATAYYENELAVFRPINEREAAALEENHYEEIDQSSDGLRTPKRIDINMN